MHTINHNKLTVILGGGESGIGAALLAKQQGYEVLVSDNGAIGEEYKKELEASNISFEEHGHTEERVLAADRVIISPGIPKETELIQKIRTTNIPVISEIEFAYQFKGMSKIIAITGSNGKSTMTAFIYHLCKTNDIECAMVGNIGYSFARQIAMSPKDLYIIEVSSFQLDGIQTFRPDIAIITNITADHLDRYEYKIQNYIDSKFRIAMNQAAEDTFIYSADDEITAENISNYQIKSALVSIEGKNLLSAGMAVAKALGIGIEKVTEAIATFKGLKHRMEHVAVIDGVIFINDSKATNVDSTKFALERTATPIILILGGVDKGNDYSLIASLVKGKVKAIVCLGSDTEKIYDAFEPIVSIIRDIYSMSDAVSRARAIAEEGDTILLSPACASFDLFKNYEDRGEKFKEAVKKLSLI